MTDEEIMRKAIELAKISGDEGEVPVGAVVTKNGEIIATGRNRREPCPMCAGAIINSRIKRVVYGASDLKAGSFGSVVNFNSLAYNHKPEIIGGILEEECAALLSNFFLKLRQKRAKNKEIDNLTK